MGKSLGIAALIMLGSLYGCGGGGGGGATIPVRPTPLAFSSWSATPFGQPVQLQGIAQEVPYTTSSILGNIQAVDVPSSVSASSSLLVGYLGNPTRADLLQINTPSGLSIGSGGFNIDAGLGCSSFSPCFAILGSVTPGQDSSFPYLDTTLGARPLFSSALVANPYVLGWNYQTFGIWNEVSLTGGTNRLGAISAGSPTPNNSIPLSGTATFTGKLAGYYVSPTGGGPSLTGADANLNVNFTTRSLNFSSTSTMLGGTPAPNLNLTGTLTYAPQTNVITGTLTNSGSTMSGMRQAVASGPSPKPSLANGSIQSGRLDSISSTFC